MAADTSKTASEATKPAPRKDRGKPRQPRRAQRPELAQRIASARTAAGMSQSAAAKKLGRSQASVADWETGRGKPDITTLGQLAELFGVAPTWLLTGDPDEGKTLIAAERAEGQRDLFAWTLHRVAAMLVEERFDSNLTVLVGFTRRLLREAARGGNEPPSEDRILRAVEQERTALRQRRTALLTERI